MKIVLLTYEELCYYVCLLDQISKNLSKGNSELYFHLHAFIPYAFLVLNISILTLAELFLILLVSKYCHMIRYYRFLKEILMVQLTILEMRFHES